MEQSHPEPKPFEYDGGYEQAYKEVDPGDDGSDPGHLGGAHGDGAVEPGEKRRIRTRNPARGV